MNKRYTLTSLYILLLMTLGAVALVCGSLLLHYGNAALAVLTFAVSLSCFLLITIHHIRFIRWIRREAATAETAERFRAEQAEVHVTELRHYIDELEQSAMALRESRERFRHAAYHDGLTGLGNRNKLLEIAERRLLERAGSNEFAVIFIDLDRFKTINDSLGHSIGDRLLVQVGERLVKCVGNPAAVARLGGDDFAVFLEDVKSQCEAEKVADLLVAAMADPFEIEGRSIFTKATAGIAVSAERYLSAEEILRDASIALYCAKETKSEIVIFDQRMHDRAVKLLEIETDLRFALKRNEFELYYQPIIDLDALELAGYEALVRWNHPCRGLVTPTEFIAVAEGSGLILPITVELLRSACENVVKWSKIATNQPVFVSVNLSAGHLSRPGIVDSVRCVLLETGAKPEMLKLEITESAVMDDAERAILVLSKIRELGVGLSIDDFGTGYSSLSYLQRLPVNTLKIDRSFVSAMEDNSDNGEIVRTIIAMARTLRLNVIAEGVETVHHLNQLRLLGCDFGQGYLFSPPVTSSIAAEMAADIERWRSILPDQEIGTVTKNFEIPRVQLH
ncbi:MAG: hypothetical protein C4324_08600 [Blastocatellia bacterium]